MYNGLKHYLLELLVEGTAKVNSGTLSPEVPPPMLVVSVLCVGISFPMADFCFFTFFELHTEMRTLSYFRCGKVYL